MYLQGSRGFTIVSVVLGVLSVFTGIVGLEVCAKSDYPLNKLIYQCQHPYCLKYSFNSLTTSYHMSQVLLTLGYS